MQTETMKQEKPYQFKKQENGKFKAFQRGTEKLLEGFEDKEFGSPLEGVWFFKSLQENIDKKAPEKERIWKGSSKKNELEAATDITQGAETAEDSEISILDDNINIIESKEKFYEIILHENDESKKTHAFVTDGVLLDFYIALDQKAIVPESVINVAREAIYTMIENHYDAKEGKTWNVPHNVARFSINVIREVPYGEAKKYLMEQKKLSRRI